MLNNRKYIKSIDKKHPFGIILSAGVFYFIFHPH